MQLNFLILTHPFEVSPPRCTDVLIEHIHSTEALLTHSHFELIQQHAAGLAVHVCCLLYTVWFLKLPANFWVCMFSHVNSSCDLPDAMA